MCGIVGVVDTTGLSYNQQKFFKNALYIDALRGMHSTGVATLTKDFNTHVYKKALNAADFLQLSTTDKVLDKYLQKVMMLGHNRHATVGDIVDDNAHPFQHGNITMVHNGSLRTQWQLEDHMRFDVDSEVIAHNLNKVGVEETVSKLNGAFALVWHDAEDNTLNFVRNSERPMHYAVLSNTAFVFGSEPKMLELAAYRNNLTFKENKIFTLGSGVLMTVDLNSKELSFPQREVRLYLDGTRGWGQQSQQKESKKDEKKGEEKKAEGKGTEESSVIYLPQDPKPRKRYGFELLDKMELKVGEEVDFIVTHWERFNGRNKDKGVLCGYLQDDSIAGHKPTWADIEVYGAYNVYDEGSMYKSTIVGCRPDKDGNGIVILNIDNVEIVTDVPFEKKEDAAIIETAQRYEEEHGKSVFNDDEEEEEQETVLLGHGGKFIPLKDWKEATKSGCGFCSCDLTQDMADDLVWYSSFSVVCPECNDKLESETVH